MGIQACEIGLDETLIEMCLYTRMKMVPSDLCKSKKSEHSPIKLLWLLKVPFWQGYERIVQYLFVTYSVRNSVANQIYLVNILLKIHLMSESVFMSTFSL